MDFSSYNEILVVITGKYSGNNDYWHVINRFKPSDFERVRSDTEYKCLSGMPLLNIGGYIAGSSFAVGRLYVMSTPNTYKLDCQNSDYHFIQVDFIGCK